MFFEPYIILIVLLVTMGLFIWGRWRYDIVAAIALTVSVAVGAVPFDKVYSGLSNPAVITVACVMIISQAITRSGVLTPIIKKIGLMGHSTTLHIASLTIVTALLSAFMNNVGALALMMPIAIRSALDHKRSPSLVLMPLALGSALGGLLTVIGTPPNLLISAYRQELTGQAFAMFDFSYVGLAVAAIGLLFIAVVGWRLIPSERKSAKGSEDIFQIKDYITEIKIPKESPTVGSTVKELEGLTEGDFTILSLIRNKRKRLVINPQQVLNANDILIIEARPENLHQLLQAGKLELLAEKKSSSDLLLSQNIGLIEAVIPQGSRLEGRSSQQIRLRSRYQLNLLAIARKGKPFRERLSHVKLQAGDVVLLQGDAENLRPDAVRLGFLPLVERGVQVDSEPARAYFPLVIFGLAILCAAFNLLPIQVAFGGAVLAMVLFKVIPVRSMYENIEWPIIILLAAMIPIGSALQTTGGTALISHYFVGLAGDYSPTIILILLLILTMTLSDFMNNAATTVVMAPIAVSIAQALNVSVDPFLMAVAVGASCSFLTPIGHQNNTLVMGPGGYQFYDYVRLGLPLEIIVVIVSVPFILWAWPI